MLDLRDVGRSPCTTCRIVAIIIAASILSIFHNQGVENSDFFGLRYYSGAHVPAAIDVFLTFVNMAVIWTLCERVIVDRFIRRKAAGATGQDEG